MNRFRVLLLFVFFAIVVPPKKAQSLWMGSTSYCPTCGPMMFPRSYSPMLPYGMPVGAPWYYPYGALSYNNFRYPSPWNTWGMSPHYYPGRGHVGFGKPNVYVEAPVGTEVEISPLWKNFSNLLAAVPPLDEKGWKVQVKAPDLYEVDGARYGHLFYDFRGELKDLQSHMAFCGDSRESLVFMAKTLKTLGFKEREVTDFGSYWSVKLPAAKQYCVYPQENRELDRLVELKVKAKGKVAVVRISFLVVPRLRQKRFLAYSQAPKKQWQANKPQNLGAQIIVREWGVGFLFQE